MQTTSPLTNSANTSPSAQEFFLVKVKPKYTLTQQTQIQRPNKRRKKNRTTMKVNHKTRLPHLIFNSAIIDIGNMSYD